VVQISGRFRSNPGVSTFKWALRMGRPPSLNLTGSHTNIGRGRYISFKNPNGDVVVVGLNANDTPRCGNVFGAILYQEPNVFTRQARDKHSNVFEKERFLFQTFLQPSRAIGGWEGCGKPGAAASQHEYVRCDGASLDCRRSYRSGRPQLLVHNSNVISSKISASFAVIGE
jgi:hypothetical protein